MNNFKYNWEPVEDDIIEENNESIQDFTKFAKFFSDNKMKVNWNRIKKYDKDMLQR